MTHNINKKSSVNHNLRNLIISNNIDSELKNG